MSALDDAASLDIWAHGELQRMKEELTRLRAENTAQVAYISKLEVVILRELPNEAVQLGLYENQTRR